MRLVSFSIENFRNITKANKISLHDYSVIVGPNNQGKSNILHALVLAMEALVDWQRQVRRTADGRLIRTVTTLPRRRFRRVRFDWNVDFPVSKQRRNLEGLTCDVILEFEFNTSEIAEFREQIGSNLNGTLPIMVSFRA